MEVETAKIKLCKEGVRFYLALVLLAFFTSSCSKQKSDVDLSVSEATQVDKISETDGSSEMHGLLAKTQGVYPVFGDNRNFVSATVIEKVPIYAKHSRVGLQASKQAAIWSACAEFASYLETKTTLKVQEAGLPQQGSNANPASEESSRSAERELSGIQVVGLHADLQTGEATAILSWKAPPSESEAGVLPKMRVALHEKTVDSTDGNSKRISNELARNIYIDSVLVISLISRTSKDESGNEEAVEEYKQFFKNGKPHLEETTAGKNGSVKIRGIIWDETGKKTEYKG